MQDMHRKWQACGRWLLKINNHVGSYMNDRPFASMKITLEKNARNVTNDHLRSLDSIAWKLQRMSHN
ncbi:hypothetical protein ACET3Z_026753 [Daucus carota]